MESSLYSSDGAELGRVPLNPGIFGVSYRPDIVHRVVEWQRSKWRLGTRCTKGISDVSGTTRKPYKQKGTGNARHGSLRSPQFRGGAVIFGPVVRSHAYRLPKKLRRLGLCTALSHKISSDSIRFLDNFPSVTKTKDFLSFVRNFFQANVLVLASPEEYTALVAVVRNLLGINILSTQGLNVYDLVRHPHVLCSRQALVEIEGRLLCK